MKFIPITARRTINTESNYWTWFHSLKNGDACIVQEFVHQGDACNGYIGGLTECWRFWKATYHSDRVWYNNDFHPINEDGYLCFHGSGELWGSVFPARLVPDSAYLHSKDSTFLDGHAPVFEPNYCHHRCVFSLDYSHKNTDLPSNFKYYYSRKVYRSKLVIVFGDADELIASAKDSPLVFCYAEPVED